MEVEGSLDDGDIVFLTNGNPDHPLQIQLDTAHEGMQPGLNHIAFFMENVEGSAGEVREQGIDSRHDPFLQPRSGRTIFTFAAPDGVSLQFARKDQRGEYEDFG